MEIKTEICLPDNNTSPFRCLQPQKQALLKMRVYGILGCESVYRIIKISNCDRIELKLYRTDQNKKVVSLLEIFRMKFQYNWEGVANGAI